GRPRRCGWFDVVVVNYAIRLNGIQQLALTKLDILDQLDEIKICTGYLYHDEEIINFPADSSILENCQPIYISLPGWKQLTSNIHSFHHLPEKAKNYISTIEELTQTPISIISVGEERKQIIFKK
ncbi:MAG: adenylosuccinate synthetase, partial [bacterium]